MLFSWGLLYPALTTPIVADDFLNPFYQYSFTRGGYWDSVVYGWDAAFNGASMRLVGNVLGALVNNFWIDLAGHAHIEMSTFYSTLKFLVFLLCAASISYCLGSIWGQRNLRYSFLNRLFLCSTILFSSLQIHALWSNDPVASYPMSGYLVSAIGFYILGFCIHTREELNSRRIAWITLVCGLAVLYYELLVGIGLLTLLILTVGVFDQKAPKKFKSAVLCLSPSLVTLATIVVSRSHSASNSGTYGGTTTALSLRALETFGMGLLSCLPGSSWLVSANFLGGSIRIKVIGVAIVMVSVVVILVQCANIPRPDLAKVTNARPWTRLVFVSSVLGFWFFAVALQSITVKVQDEASKLGYVYSYYAVGSSALALLACYLLPSVLHWNRTLLLSCFSFALMFAVVQGSVSWRISERMSESLVPNQNLLSAFSDFESVPARCDALKVWSAGNWPDYYETGMINGLQDASLGYHDEEFCPSFIRP